MKANHFSERKETVILLDNGNDVQKLSNEDGSPVIFKNLKKAQKHVSRFIDPALHPMIKYVNYEPELFAGDQEETNGAKCLKCGTQLRLSGQQNASRIQGEVLALDLYDCPKCDLGEE